MKYKEGDKVRIKSIDWYNENKDENGNVVFSSKVTHFSWCENVRTVFTKDMVKFCGKVVTIENVWTANYSIVEGTHRDYFTDEMIEVLVEEETKNNNDMEEKETLLGWVKENDSLRLVPHKDYEIKHDGDNFYLVKKKKEYPKTYEECCKVLGIAVRDLDILDNMLDTSEIIYHKNLDRLLNSFRKLLICRDAYWKLYGEEMSFSEPWEPDYKKERYVISRYIDEIVKGYRQAGLIEHFILEFPTEEMRDAFYENFKELIEFCKELL